MSKSLRSMSESERKAAIARRLASNTKGLGYWAAVDAQARLTKRAADLAYDPAELFHAVLEMVNPNNPHWRKSPNR